MIGASDIRRVSEVERLARQQAETEAWPDGVTHRYLTKAAEITGDHGLSVNIREDKGNASSRCTGCGRQEHPYLVREIHRRAQIHAETCRALPRPQANT